jgi:hypothetical protein
MPVRLVVMDAHQAGVRAVRTLIVVRPEADVSIVVGVIFVIPAQRVAAAHRGVLVEEYPREVPPCRFNAHRGSPGAIPTIAIWIVALGCNKVIPWNGKASGCFRARQRREVAGRRYGLQ